MTDSTAPHDTLPPAQDPEAGGIVEPPTKLGGILKRLGPGLIIAGSIVGSGELIATTKTGAQAGIALLWLIVIGCVIKVFVQIELGRYTITHGETTLSALDRVPGPRAKVNWILWCWLAMMAFGVGQLGGIVGGVGQSLALSIPITGDYVDAIRMPSTTEIKTYLKRNDVLLTVWDIEILNRNDQSTEWETETAESTESLLNFAEEEVTGTRARILEKVNLGELDDVQEVLDEINTVYVMSAPDNAAKGDPRSELKQLSEVQRQRAFTAHRILAEQLADLDSEDLRGTKAASAVAKAAQLKKELKDVKTPSDAQKSALASAEADAAALVEPNTNDDKYWSAVVTLITIVLLYIGRYNFIQNFSMILVVTFTFITIGNVLALQSTPQFHVSGEQFARGLSFGLPEKLGDIDPLVMALATFGIIGVGASELIAYPYWCQEKGYAKFTGPHSPDQSWANRARGWMRVMHYDAFCSMIIYTLATLAFFVMGVAVLYNEGRDPDGMRMVSTLATAYVPVFGEYARWLFLSGAIAVLYSTFMVSIAGNSRMFTDVLKVFGFMDRHNQRTHDRSVVTFSVILPLLCLAVYWSGVNPVAAIRAAGMMQSLLLPMIGFGALYFRFKHTDQRLKPSKAWDTALIVSCVGLLLVGGYGLFKSLKEILKPLL